MPLGLRAAIIGVVGLGIANTGMKKIAVDYDNNYIALIWQYVFMVLSATVYVGAISAIQNTSIFPTMTWHGRLFLVGIAIAGYIGVVLLFKGYDHVHAGICLVIANLSVFLMYFANIYLFDGSEHLSAIKIVLAVIFFCIIAGFLLSKTPDTSHLRLNKRLLYPIGTAICRTIFFVGNTRFVKTGTMTPAQSVFLTESCILLVAMGRFLIRYPGQLSSVLQSFHRSHIRIFTLIGLTNIGGNLLIYYGYLDNPANIINFIKLFSIIVASILSWIFLHDTLTKRQIRLMIAAFIVLVGFVFL